MSRVFIVCALAIAAIFTATTLPAAPPGAPVEQGEATTVTSVTLDVDGVTCAGCTFAIRREVNKLDGVRDIRSGESEKQLLVDYEKGRLTEEQILEAVKKAGYQARVRK